MCQDIVSSCFWWQRMVSILKYNNRTYFGVYDCPFTVDFTWKCQEEYNAVPIFVFRNWTCRHDGRFFSEGGKENYQYTCRFTGSNMCNRLLLTYFSICFNISLSIFCINIIGNVFCYFDHLERSKTVLNVVGNKTHRVSFLCLKCRFAVSRSPYLLSKTAWKVGQDISLLFENISKLTGKWIWSCNMWNDFVSFIFIFINKFTLKYLLVYFIHLIKIISEDIKSEDYLKKSKFHKKQFLKIWLNMLLLIALIKKLHSI